MDLLEVEFPGSEALVDDSHADVCSEPRRSSAALRLRLLLRGASAATGPLARPNHRAAAIEHQKGSVVPEGTRKARNR